MFRNASLAHREVICDHYVRRFMCKIDQKLNCVKLKSIQTLLKIACLSHRKSYMVIICANSYEKIDQKWNWVKLKSVQILLKITYIVPRKSYLLIIYTHSYENIHNINQGQRLIERPYMSYWKTIYDLLYVFHINFGHNMHHLKDHIWLTTCTCVLYKHAPVRKYSPLKTQLPWSDL